MVPKVWKNDSNVAMTMGLREGVASVALYLVGSFGGGWMNCLMDPRWIAAQVDLFDAVDTDTGQVFIPNSQDHAHQDVVLTRNQFDGNSTRGQHASDCISVNAHVLIAQWAVGGSKPLGLEWNTVTISNTSVRLA